MADVNQDGLAAAGKEPSPKEELFSGDLESPEGSESKGSESPKADVAPKEDKGTGVSTSSSEDSDPELKGIFDAFEKLEKDAPEGVKRAAREWKKKAQAETTKKWQTIAEQKKTFSKELETLRSNQITDDLKRDYSTLYGWYDKIQKNPKGGLRELASQLGVSVNALVEAAEAETPKSVELTPDKLVTAEDYAAFARQEARKAVEEIREKEVKPLRETIAAFSSNADKQDNITRGAKAVEEAKKIPGFADSEGKVTEEGNKAIASVLRGEFRGPDAIQNAFKAITADKATESSSGKIKSLEEQLAALKLSINGASNPPGGNVPKTTSGPSRPGQLWDDLRAEPLGG